MYCHRESDYLWIICGMSVWGLFSFSLPFGDKNRETYVVDIHVHHRNIIEYK